MQIVKQLLFIFTLFISIHIHTKSRPFTIMIDPSGDAKHTGRIIEDTFERGISLQFAELLKEKLNRKFKQLRIVLTRVPGETIQPLQNASFANRLDVDFYLSVYFYPEPDIPSHITLYSYQTNPTTDLWHQSIPLNFYHIDQAHLINIHVTKTLGEKFLKTLRNKEINTFFVSQGLYSIPFKPLLGIKAPALAVEVGLQEKKDFKKLIDPLINCIQESLLS